MCAICAAGGHGWGCSGLAVASEEWVGEETLRSTGSSDQPPEESPAMVKGSACTRTGAVEPTRDKSPVLGQRRVFWECCTHTFKEPDQGASVAFTRGEFRRG